MSPSEEGSKPVVVERLLEAPAGVVWNAITVRDQMKAWYFEPIEEFRPEVGFETRFDVRQGEQVFPHIWKITEVQPGRRIAYTWRYGGFPGESLVSFELSADGERTRLVLTHSGLETFRPEENPRLSRGNFVKGWTALIATLAEHVEKVAAGAKHHIDPTSRKGAP